MPSDKETLEGFGQYLESIQYPAVESPKAIEAIQGCRETIEALVEVLFDIAQKP